MTTGTSPNAWVSHTFSSVASIRLFCFPYAGGAAQIFRGWQDEVPGEIEISPVHLPGRGRRSLEKPFSELSPLAEVLADALLSHLDKPYALFGHSVGAIIAFELTRILRRKGGPLPLHLFVSGCRAPQLTFTRRHTHDLPGAELIRELRRLNGTPETILESPEMLQLFLPVIRSDLQMVQTYNYVAGPRLSCPISAFGGLQDFDETPEMLSAWREQTTSSFHFQMFAGDHFFLQTRQSDLLQAISKRLLNVVH